MTKEDLYVSEAKKHFETDGRNTDAVPLVVKNMIGVYKELNDIKYTTRKRANTIVEISPAKCSISYYVSLPTMKKTKKGNIFLFEQRSGMFKVKLKSGKVGYIAFFDSGFGKVNNQKALL